MTAPSTKQQLLDVLLDGGAAQYVRKRRGDGRSWRSIANEMNAEPGLRDRGVEITDVSLINWFGDERAAS